MESLSKLGTVTPDIKLTTYMNGYSTLELLDWEHRKFITEAFLPIVKHIWRIYNR